MNYRWYSMSGEGGLDIVSLDEAINEAIIWLKQEDHIDKEQLLIYCPPLSISHPTITKNEIKNYVNSQGWCQFRFNIADSGFVGVQTMEYFVEEEKLLTEGMEKFTQDLANLDGLTYRSHRWSAAGSVEFFAVPNMKYVKSKSAKTWHIVKKHDGLSSNDPLVYTLCSKSFNPLNCKYSKTADTPRSSSKCVICGETLDDKT